MPRAPGATSPGAQARLPTRTTSHHLRHRGKPGAAEGRTRFANSPYPKAHAKACFPGEGTPSCNQHPANTTSAPPPPPPSSCNLAGQESHGDTEPGQNSQGVKKGPAPLFEASCSAAAAPLRFGKLQVLPIRAAVAPASFPTPHPVPAGGRPLGNAVPLRPPQPWEDPCSQPRVAMCSPT